MQKPPECSDCYLAKEVQTKNGLIQLGQSFSLPEGSPKFGVEIVGESLGRHEAQEGLPFRPNGESGSLITSIIENLTIHDPKLGKARKMVRGDFRWDNVVKCRPPDDELAGKVYEKDAIEHCRVHSYRSYNSKFNPDNSGCDNDNSTQRVILALGGVAFKELTGISGKKRGIEDVRGYVFRSHNYNSLVIGSLHPSFIRHGNSRFTNALIYDVKKALNVASGSYRSYSDNADYKNPEFVRDGKLEALVSLFYRLRDNSNLPIYYDIENPYTKKGEEEDEKGDLENDEEGNGKESDHEITSIQFAYSKDWAINVPWEKPFIKVALAILALENEKIGANVWHHDNPRLEANGARIGGRIHDLMWAWHHLQSGLWKGLQRIGSFFDVPRDWKYLGLSGDEKDDNDYGCWDVIAPAYIWPSLVKKMKAVGVWESYNRFKVDYEFKVLKPTEKRGLFVDVEEHKEFKIWVEGEVKKEDEQLQSEVPQSLRNIVPRRKIDKDGDRNARDGGFSFGYIREPPIIRGLRAGYEITRERMLERGVPATSIIQFEKWAERKSGLSFREVGATDNGNGAGNGIGGRVRRWCRIEPFKASSQQLIRYLKYKGYKVPTTLKDGRETTGKKELQELWESTGDELLGNVIRIRSYNKMLTNDIPNWIPDKDGVVRTTFKFDPPSWQLNSVKPNIQNASKHPKEWELFGKTASELTLIGQRFRRIVKAPPGRCVVEFDKTAFHVSMMGFEARDPLYIKWAPYMHTIFTSYIVGEPIPIEGEIDHDKLGYVKKKYKNIRDGQAKPTVLGNQLGLGHHKLFYMNKSFIDGEGKRQIGIESKKRAKYLQEFLGSLFPKVEDYKKRIKEEAHYKSFLLSNYGCLRWFHDVLRWDYKSRSMKNGSEAEEAQSHKIQSNAFGMIHSEALDMAETSEILEEHHYANTIHDSFIFFPEIEKRERCIEEVYGYMMKPERVLSDPVCAPGGLVVGVEIMASCEGGNWANGHKERNPMGMFEVKIN